jgi:hypothetical protein
MIFGRINWRPDRGQVRSFAITLPPAAILGGLIFLALSGWCAAIWVTAVGTGLGMLSYLLPPFGRIVYWLWMGIGYLLGRITSPLFAALIFFLLVAPVGLIRRIGGRDPMGLRRVAGTAQGCKAKQLL